MSYDRKELNFTYFKGIKMVTNIAKMYKWTKVLGSGSFGQVHEAMNLNANVPCAVKIMSKKKMCKDRSNKEHVKKELAML